VLHPDRLGRGDGDKVHVFFVPERLENRIGEPEREDVLNGFLAQIMVDTEDLVLFEIGEQNGVECLRGFQVVANGFLHHQPRVVPVLGESGRAQVLGNFAEEAGWRGHVEHAVRLGAPPLFQISAGHL